MDGREIIEKLKSLLNSHFLGHFGHIGEESYKSSFFELFEEAYNSGYFDVEANPRLTGDAIRDTLEEIWLIDIDENEQENARNIMKDLLRRWDEWWYAWKKKDI